MNFREVKNHFLFYVLAGASAVFCALPLTRAADAAAKSIPITKIKRSAAVDFEREILPSLKNNCIACHNQTKPKGGLVMETPQTILKGGDAGPAIVPKKPGQSLLLKAAAHQDPELIMPPPDNKVAAVALKPEELGLLQLWIEQGAKGVVRATVPVAWQPMPAGLNAIYAVALTRDGQFAACGRANQIFVYHLPTGRLAARLSDPQLQKAGGGAASHRDTVNSLAFSPDGEVLASGGYREVKLWRRGKPFEKFRLPGGTDLLASSGSNWLATASTNGEVRLSDKTGKLAGSIPSRPARITALKLAHGSNLLALARGRRVAIASVPAGIALAKAEMPGEVTSFADLGPRGWAVACGDDVIRILGAGTNAGSLMTAKEIKSPTAIAFLESSAATPHQLLAGGVDGTLQVWDLTNDRVALTVHHGSALTSMAIRPDGKYFASAGGNTARLWKINETNSVAELKGDARAWLLVAESDREVTFAKAEIDYRKSAVKAAETNQLAAVARHKKADDTNTALVKIAADKQTALTNAMAAQHEAEKAVEDLGPEIKKLLDTLATAERESTNAAALAKAATGGTDKLKAERLARELETKSNLLAEAKAALEKLPAETKAKQKLLTQKQASTAKAVVEAEKEFKKSDQARSTAENEWQLAAEGLKKAEIAAAAARSAQARAEADLQKAQTFKDTASHSFSQTQSAIQALAFSPDNSLVITGSEDGAVRTWTASNGTPCDVITNAGPIKHVAALDRNTAVSVGDLKAAAWSLEPTWTLVRNIGTGDVNSPLADRVNALRFTADGRQLLTGGGEPTRGGEIKLWRVANGTLVRDFANVHSDSVFALDISADGKYLATGSADRFAKIVDMTTAKVTKTLEGHTHHVLSVAWRRDNRTVLTAGADNVAKVWDATTGARRKNIEGFGKELTGAAYIGVTDEAVLSAGDGQVVLVKDQGDKVRSFTGATDFVSATAATPDGRVIIAGGADGVLRAWNGKDGKLIAEFPRP